MERTFNSAGETINATDGDVLTAGPGADVVVMSGGTVTIRYGTPYSLTGSGSTDTVWNVESIFGTTTNDTVSFNSLSHGGGVGFGNPSPPPTTVYVQGIETLIGTPDSFGRVATLYVRETLRLSDAGNTMAIVNPYVVIGGSGIDDITVSSSIIPEMGLTVDGVEVVRNLPLDAFLTLGNSGNTVQVVGRSSFIYGGTGADAVTFVPDARYSEPAVLTLNRVETLTATSGSETVLLADSTTITINGVDALQGSIGTDVVTLGPAGSTLFTNRVETLHGGVGLDVVIISANGSQNGSTMTVTGLETLYGSWGTDVITLGAATPVMSVYDVESIIGSSGTDRIFADNPLGSTMTVQGVEAVTAGSGTDVLTLAGSFNWITLSGIDNLTGSAGVDWVDLGHNGNTLTIRGVEVLTGGAGTDAVTLGDNAGTLFFSGIETLTGSSGSDGAVVGAGTVWFRGGWGGDTITLHPTAGADVINFTGSEDGGELGMPQGHDTINGFRSGEDLVVISGGLFNGLDRDGNGSMGKQAAGTNGIGPGNGIELFHLAGTLPVLADAELSSVRRAIGTLQGGSGNPFLLIASDGTDSGLYLVQDNGNDGNVTAADVRLLAVFTQTLINGNDITFR